MGTPEEWLSELGRVPDQEIILYYDHSVFGAALRDTSRGDITLEFTAHISSCYTIVYCK